MTRQENDTEMEAVAKRMIPRLLKLRRRDERKLAERSMKRQDLVKTAASRLMT